MQELVVAPWLLRLGLWILLGSALVMLAMIVMARASRSLTERRHVNQLAPFRRDVIALASGDDDGSAEQRLRQTPTGLFRQVDPLLMAYLSKVGGEPARTLVEVLSHHGVVRRAKKGVGARGRTRRAESAWVLGLMRRDEAAQQIVPLLQDRDRGVAVTAARSLGLIGDADTAQALLASVRPERKGRGGLPVWVVIEALSALDHEAADVIGAALASEDATTRTVAAVAIGRAQHVSQIEPLRQAAAVEDTPVTLRSMAGALGAVGGREDVATLTALAAGEGNRGVRLAAARSLAEMGDAASREALVDLLRDSDPRLAELAAESLTDFGPGGLQALHDEAGGAGPAADAAAFGLALHEMRQHQFVGD